MNHKTRVNFQPTRGFTLIELLVVVAIISLLVSILLPSLKSGLQIARQVQCASNFRQLGLGMSLYAHDFDNYVVPLQECYDGPYLFTQLNLTGGNEMNRSPAYYHQVFQCPSNERARDFLHYIGSVWVMTAIDYRSTAPNGCGNPKSVYNPWSRYSNFVIPSDTMMMVESHSIYPPVGGYGGAFGTYYEKAVLPWLDDLEGDMGIYHNEGSNLLWADGHVSHSRAVDVPVEWFRPEVTHH